MSGCVTRTKKALGPCRSSDRITGYPAVALSSSEAGDHFCVCGSNLGTISNDDFLVADETDNLDERHEAKASEVQLDNAIVSRQTNALVIVFIMVISMGENKNSLLTSK